MVLKALILDTFLDTFRWCGGSCIYELCLHCKALVVL